MNGATSVIGTVGATIIAIHRGFSATLAWGAGMYLAAAVTGVLLARLVAKKAEAPAAAEATPQVGVG